VDRGRFEPCKSQRERSERPSCFGSNPPEPILYERHPTSLSVSGTRENGRNDVTASAIECGSNRSVDRIRTRSNSPPRTSRTRVLRARTRVASFSAASCSPSLSRISFCIPRTRVLRAFSSSCSSRRPH